VVRSASSHVRSTWRLLKPVLGRELQRLEIGSAEKVNFEIRIRRSLRSPCRAALITVQLGTNMLRPILQMGRERMPVLKDTQTAIEAGYPIFETLAWWGIFAPKDTPPDVIASMAKSVKEILSERWRPT
jgi:hypothetical protein